MAGTSTKVAGATVTIDDDAPSVQIVKAAAKTFEVVDDLGRTITLKKPAPLANLDFAKAAGGADINQLYLAEVAHLKFVSAIDGEPVPTPGTDAELRALYARLGDEGNEAAQLGVYRNFIPQTAEAGDAELKNY
jgi:hypothetical protein